MVRFCERATFLKLVCSNKIRNNSSKVHFMRGVPGKGNEVCHLLYNIYEVEMFLCGGFIYIFN